ncbi:MAG: EFR1 family ferrodoxin [Acutalibacteraceae bacterium]|nr:EFR1 family ferrodoxin [Acutalibacteraceae bacterium]
MVGIYFSGTGNSKYALEVFLREYDLNSKAFSIEDDNAIKSIKEHKEIIFSYPVQYSTVPKILRDFIKENNKLWQNKKVFIIATMGLFSGDGTGVLGRLLQLYGAEVIGGLHIKMPDSIADERVLKRPLEKNKQLVKNAEKKLKKAVLKFKEDNPPQEGLGIIYRISGFLGQRLLFGNKTKYYTDKLKIDAQKCVACGRCVKICPMKNIEIVDNTVKQNNQCTMCYRCINYCPKKAITLLGKEVIEQSVIEKYL